MIDRFAPEKTTLADIEKSRMTAKFARLRARYPSSDDDAILEMLFDGISKPDLTSENMEK